MNYTKAVRDKKPARCVVLPSSGFADTWDKKPATDAAIGLRFLSQHDLDSARREAEKEAQGFYREFRERDKAPDDETLADVFNDAFLANVCARGTCNPNDVTLPYFPFAEDVVRLALTPEAMRRVWDELLLLHKGSIVARPAASDEDVQRLASALPKVTLDLELRRIIAYVVEKLGAQVDEHAASDADAEDDSVYHAVAR